MRLRNLIRSATWIVAVLVCSTWLLASVGTLSDDGLPPFGPWSAPVNLGTTVNTAALEQGPFISKDGLSLYFQSDRPGGYGGNDIYVSQRISVNDPWGPGQNVGPTINTPFNEATPAVSIDGHRLYFQSNRPGGFGGADIYVSRRHNKRDDFGWQFSENLGSTVNTTAAEQQPSILEDDSTGEITLYFNSNRPGGFGGDDVYASTLQPDETFGLAVLVPELSSPFNDRGPSVRKDGLEMFISSNRPPNFGGGFDLFVSTRPSTADPWSPPVNLGPVVNFVGEDARPAISFDGTTLYFTSSLRPANVGGSGFFDLWVTTRTKVSEPN